ncbi:MAG: MBL fold metallo-hydrolase [Desulfurococcaceae archaeon]
MTPTSKERVAMVETLILVDDYTGFTKLLGEHGFSALITATYESGRKYNILLDVGESGSVLAENSTRLGVKINEVDVLVVSHRHHDHTGGLQKAVESLGGKPLLAHPALMKPCYADSKGFKRFDVGLTLGARRALSAFELILIKTPLELAPDIWFLGEIERHYSNEYAVKGFKTLYNDQLVDDPMMDDTGIAIRVGNKVIVAVGCSHSGVQNIARQARRTARAEDLVIVGGFHLADADEETTKTVIEELSGEGVSEVHTGHCTGLRGEAELLVKYRNRMRKIHSGYKVEVKAD